MKFTVDQELCIGCAACEDICPTVFERPESTSKVKLNPVPKKLQENALEAEESCPVAAISHKT